MIKVVLDSNILISAIFWNGSPRRVVDLAIADKIASFTSIEILQEIQSVLLENFGVPDKRQEMILRDILLAFSLPKTGRRPV